MIYVPRGDESMMPTRCPPPVQYNPYHQAQQALDDGRALIEQEIEALREILNRSWARRRRDD